MRCIVTGGTGFLGQKLAQKLATKGHDVLITGRNEKLSGDLPFLKMDLRDPAITDCMKEADFVFHCGALSTPWGDYEDFYQTNVVGTRHILKGSLKYGVKRVIHVSSPSIYFDYADRLNISENDPLPKVPCNKYAKSKLLAEQEVDHYFSAGLPVITLRPRGIFGPGDRTIFPRLIEANQNQRLPLIRGGQALLDMTYVDNVVDALLLCMDSPKFTLGKKYNISNDEPWKAIDLVQLLFKELGQPFKPIKTPYSLAYFIASCMELFSKKEPSFTKYSVGVIAKSQTLNIDAAKKELGYLPKVSVEEGIKRFAVWWRMTHEKC